MTKKSEGFGAKEGEVWFYLSLEEVIQSLQVPKELIFDMINEGIISVKKNKNNEWQFDSEAFCSMGTVLRLTRDLGVNMQGAALALELLREIDRLQLLLQQK